MNHDRGADAVPIISAVVGRRLRQARDARGWRLVDLGSKIGADVSVINRAEWARRDPTLVLLVAMSAQLGVRLSDALRVGEDQAVPLPAQVWTEEPALYLGHRVVETPHDAARLARAGRADCTDGGPPDAVALVAHGVGLLLWRARRRQHLDQAVVADRCGVRGSVICRVELARKNVRLPRLIAVSMALGVRLSDILRLAEDHVFPTTVWTDTSSLVTAHGQAATDLDLPRWAVPWYTSRPHALSGPGPVGHRPIRCGHDGGAEINAELRGGQVVDVARCVTCCQPIPRPVRPFVPRPVPGRLADCGPVMFGDEVAR